MKTRIYATPAVKGLRVYVNDDGPALYHHWLNVPCLVGSLTCKRVEFHMVPRFPRVAGGGACDGDVHLISVQPWQVYLIDAIAHRPETRNLKRQKNVVILHPQI